jgi:hypothetical protein
MSHVLIAKLLLEAAMLAEASLAKAAKGSQDAQFYQGKIASARFFARNLLPVAAAQTDVIASGDATAWTPDRRSGQAVTCSVSQTDGAP